MENLFKLLKKSTKATLHIPADFFDNELDSLSTVLNSALAELLADDSLTIEKELVDDEYVIGIALKTEE